jgi:uncharacterized membrane protein
MALRLDSGPWSLLLSRKLNARKGRTLSQHKKTTGHRVWPWWRLVLMVLSSLGLILSAYLGWHHLVGGSVIGCGGGSPCDQVLNSRWSSIGGVLPVSGLAAGAYLALLVAGLFIGPTTEAPVRRLAWGAMLILVGTAAGSAIWFIIVQKWIVRAFCPYCMAAHSISLTLAALVIWRALRQFDGDSPAPLCESSPATSRSVIGRRPEIGFALVGLALAGVLAASQVFIIPPAVYRAGESQNSLPDFDPGTAPLVGSPDAPHIVKLLFDYKCPHCQQLHFMLDEVVRRYQGKLAFALCPTPLERQCNPYVPRDVAAFTNSCELAKIGLAVWLAQREAFRAFELWMFSLESGDRWQPRSLEAAKAKAVELVGQAKFDAALADPWIDRYLQTAVKLFGDTGSDAIPKLVFGSRWVIPQPNDADDLITILQENLAVPKP